MAITDLTGTTWRINEVPVVSQSLQPTIFYTANNSDYVAFVCIPTSPGNYQITYATQSGSSDPDVIAYNTTTGGWNTTGGADYRTIVISEDQHGQTGVTNSAFIAWLEANAVQVIPPVVISYNSNTIATIDTNGTEILDTEGTYLIDDITIKYIAPTSGTDVSDTTATPSDVLASKYFYDASGVKTQGTIATYAGEHHTPGYAVAISLTNSYDTEFFDTCEVYQLNSRNLDEYGFYDDLTLLGTIDSPTGSTTVTVDSAALAIVIALNGTGMGVVVYDSPTISSNITDLGYLLKPYPDMGYSNSWFEVSGAGTITLSRIDWYDD